MKMNETVKCMIDHPFASAFIVGAISTGIARIIATIKGVEVKPAMSISIDKPVESENK